MYIRCTTAKGQSAGECTKDTPGKHFVHRFNVQNKKITHTSINQTI